MKIKDLQGIVKGGVRIVEQTGDSEGYTTLHEDLYLSPDWDSVHFPESLLQREVTHMWTESGLDYIALIIEVAAD